CISMPLGIGYREHFIFVLGTVILHSCQYNQLYQGKQELQMTFANQRLDEFQRRAIASTICNQKDFVEVAVYSIILGIPKIFSSNLPPHSSSPPPQKAFHGNLPEKKVRQFEAGEDSCRTPSHPPSSESQVSHTVIRIPKCHF
ncbi:hypothetical protein STEG23_004905, partial [Scotinomys teguina]